MPNYTLISKTMRSASFSSVIDVNVLGHLNSHKQRIILFYFA